MRISISILDRYIMRKFLGTFLFVMLLFSMIAVIIDFSQNVEEFIDEQLSPRQVVTEYYLNFVIFINGLLWPLFVLITVIFFTSRLAYNAEVIAILNAGVSYGRFLRPYFLAAGMVASTHLVMNHYLIPMSNKPRLDFFHSYIMKESEKGNTRDVHMFTAPGEKVYMRDYFKRDSFGRNFRLEHFEGSRLRSFLEAEEIRWQGRPNKWQLHNYEVHTFDGRAETIRVGRNAKLDTILNLVPEDFVRYDATKEMIPSHRLHRFIEEEQMRGVGNTKVYEIELHRRSADPFMILVVTLIGVAVASRKVRGGLGLHLAIGVVTGAVFIFLSKFSMTFANGETLSAFWGVWLPNLVFSALAAWLTVKAQK